jgi:hypothetical protein
MTTRHATPVILAASTLVFAACATSPNWVGDHRPFRAMADPRPAHP